jgi:catechol 2,3-dioxygenase-like lactoylglutathione lyase family enzyme
MRLTFHHVGCLVEDIPAALAAYTGTCLAAEASAPVAVRSQKVRVCFLPSGNGAFIEFVEPERDNAFLMRMLRKGISYYHVGYLCVELEECVRSLLAAGAHELTRFSSEAFGGRLCVFLLTAQQQMLELIETA